MGIAWEQHSISRLRHRKQTGLEQTRSPVYAKPAVINTHRCSQPRLTDGYSSL